MTHIISIETPPVPATPGTYTDDNTFTQGDFTLVSADGVRFKVPSYELFSAIPAFHGASSNPEDTCIEFIDDKIETAQVLHMFLSVATTADFGPKFTPDPDSDSNLQELMGLFLFADKYAAERVRRCALNLVSKLVAAGELYPDTGLIVGCATKDVQCCMVALRANNTPFSSTTDYVDGFEWNGKRSQIQRFQIPWKCFSLMSSYYSWALGIARNPITGEVNPDQFKNLLAQGDADPLLYVYPNSTKKITDAQRCPRHWGLVRVRC